VKMRKATRASPHALRAIHLCFKRAATLALAAAPRSLDDLAPSMLTATLCAEHFPCTHVWVG
jgi:hypothetical protein